MHLGELCAAIAEYQLKRGRHFIVENPVRSELYHMDHWVDLKRRYDLAVVRFHQCMTGLIGRKTGLPIQKHTEMWASDDRLLRRLASRQSHGRHQHVVLGYRYRRPGEPPPPSERPEEAQVWPRVFCKLLAEGCLDVLNAGGNRAAAAP